MTSKKVTYHQNQRTGSFTIHMPKSARTGTFKSQRRSNDTGNGSTSANQK